MCRSSAQEVGTMKWASPGTICPGLSAQQHAQEVKQSIIHILTKEICCTYWSLAMFPSKVAKLTCVQSFLPMCSREQNCHFLGKKCKVLIIKLKVAASCGSYSLHNKSGCLMFGNAVLWDLLWELIIPNNFNDRLWLRRLKMINDVTFEMVFD